MLGVGRESMAVFVKLTRLSGKPVYVQVQNISSFCESTKGNTEKPYTRVAFIGDNDSYVNVRETPADILQIIREVGKGV